MKQFLLTLAVAMAAHVPAWADSSPLRGFYWFDAEQTAQPLDILSGAMLLDASALNSGLHSLNLMAVDADGVTSPILSRWFLKTGGMTEGGECVVRTEVDGKERQTSRMAVQAGGQLLLDLDMSDISLGFHSLGVQVFLPDGTVSPMMTGMFMRVPTAAEMSALNFYYMIDGKLAGGPIAVGQGGVCHLTPDVSNLSTGVHSISGYLASPTTGLASQWTSKLFIKIPNGGYGIRSYEYWINGDESTHTSVKLDRTTNQLSLVKLLDVPAQPFRSAFYGFALENGAPVVYGRNEFVARFYDPDGRIISNTGQFNDVRVRKPVESLRAITPGRTRLDAQAANSIDWFTFTAEQGDSIGIKLTDAAMWELYDPKGEPVKARSGIESTANFSAVLHENGTYYLAVHDIIGSRSTSVDFVHIPRFALLGFTPDRSSNSDLLIMELRGNGFDSLEGIELRGENGTVRPAAKIEKYNNQAAYAMFDFDETPLANGKYTPVVVIKNPDNGELVSETAPNRYLTIETPDPDGDELRVSIVQDQITHSPYGTHITVTNQSNKGLWGVPVNIAVGSNSRGSGTVNFNNFGIYAKNEMPADVPMITYTDNLLGTGSPGAYIPAVIPYIPPHQSITLDTGYEIERGSESPTYVWTEEPMSVRFRQMSSPTYDYTQIFNRGQRCNSLAAEALELAVYGWASRNNIDLGFVPAGGAGTVGDGSDTDRMRAFVADYGGVIGHINGNVETVMRQSIGIGATLGGFYLGLSLRELDAVIEAYGISPDDPEFGYLFEMREQRLNGMRHANDLMMEALQLNDPGTLQGFIAQLWLSRNGNGRQAALPVNPMPRCHAVQGYVSFDPNEMTGHRSASGDNYIAADVETVTYTIEFENDPEFANAPASRIAVSNTVDGIGLDRTSLRPLKLQISDKEIELPAEHHFVKTVDMRPNINAIAELDFNYDAESGEADWKLRSLDPMTLEPITDFSYGILPVNDDLERGIGRLTFSVDVKDGVADGLEIPAKASIVFDDNEPIETPVWTNITDLTEPTSRIVALETSDNKTFDFAVDGSDAGSGIWTYDLLVRPAGSTDWTTVKTMIEATEFSYTSETELIGADFAVIATDRAGNRQSVPASNSLRGDADGNGRVDANDVVVIRNHYTGKAMAVNAINADVSRDGRIDAQDAIGARNLYLDQKIRNLKPKRR